MAGALVPATLLADVAAFTDFTTGWYGAKRVGAGVGGRRRSAATLMARNELSIVLAALGAPTSRTDLTWVPWSQATS